jgi:hypothetical protein
MLNLAALFFELTDLLSVPKPAHNKLRYSEKGWSSELVPFTLRGTTISSRQLYNHVAVGFL